MSKNNKVSQKNIAVFCSASDVAEVYTQATELFGKLLAESGYDLIWGGSNTGLMEKIATAVETHGGKLIGISTEVYRHELRPNAHEIILTPTLGERKKLFLERADAVVCLVGGIGSLDEITEILEFKKQRKHNKPVVFLNTNHFYDGLKAQLERMEKEGFLPLPLSSLIFFAQTPQAAIDYITTLLKAE